MLTERLRKLEKYVREYREVRIKWDRIEGIDGYTPDYFKLKKECERLERVKDRELELTPEQQDKVKNFRSRQRKLNK